MAGLILKRAPAFRRSGEWDDDDFDVLEDGAVVGRIFTRGRWTPMHPCHRGAIHRHALA